MSGGATGGVQNYKGVMLCNRPADDAPPEVNPAMEAPRFRPGGLASEPIGLNPAKENLVSNMQAVEAEAARRRAEDPERLAPDTVMTKHKRWLAEMARKKEALNAELADSAVHAASKRKVFEAYTKTLRQAVRERSAELDDAGVQHAYPKMRADPAPPPPAAAAVAPRSRPPSSGGAKKKGPPKPKWAMTETEADDIEEEEAAALVDQHGQKCPPWQTSLAVAVPQLGSCASAGRAWWLRAARHSPSVARPQGTQPPPRGLKRAASKGRASRRFHCVSPCNIYT